MDPRVKPAGDGDAIGDAATIAVAAVLSHSFPKGLRGEAVALGDRLVE
jgi:hypothetical protein